MLTFDLPLNLSTYLTYMHHLLYLQNGLNCLAELL